MKQKIFCIIGLIVVMFLFTSGLFEFITNVFVWIITINLNQPTISIVGQIFVKYATWLNTFGIVGFIFKSLNWFDSFAMKIVYIIVSTIIAFALSYGIMLLEKYIFYIGIGLVIILVGLAISLTVLYYKHKTKLKTNEEKHDQ